MQLCMMTGKLEDYIVIGTLLSLLISLHLLENRGPGVGTLLIERATYKCIHAAFSSL